MRNNRLMGALKIWPLALVVLSNATTQSYQVEPIQALKIISVRQLPVVVEVVVIAEKPLVRNTEAIAERLAARTKPHHRRISPPLKYPTRWNLCRTMTNLFWRIIPKLGQITSIFTKLSPSSNSKIRHLCLTMNSLCKTKHRWHLINQRISQ